MEEARGAIEKKCCFPPLGTWKWLKHGSIPRLPGLVWRYRPGLRVLGNTALLVTRGSEAARDSARHHPSLVLVTAIISEKPYLGKKSQNTKNYFN